MWVSESITQIIKDENFSVLVINNPCQSKPTKGKEKKIWPDHKFIIITLKWFPYELHFEWQYVM